VAVPKHYLRLEIDYERITTSTLFWGR
jgi:hypothetical protein